MTGVSASELALRLATLKARAADGKRPTDKANGRWLGDLLDRDTPTGLLPAELQLLIDCAAGEMSDGGGGWAQPPESLVLGSDGTAPCTIRAKFLRFLVLGGDADTPIHESGLRVHRAHIKDALDVRGAKCVTYLSFTSCCFDANFDLAGADLGTIILSGSRVNGFRADGATFTGGLWLDRRFISKGKVSLVRTRIALDLDFSGAMLDAGPLPDDLQRALDATAVMVGGDVNLRDNCVEQPNDPIPFKASGRVWLRGAQVGGNVDCTGGEFKNPDGWTLDISGARVAGDVRLCQYVERASTTQGQGGPRFTAQGLVNLYGSDLGGHLDCQGGRFDAIDATIIKVGRCVYLCGAGSPNSLKGGNLQPFESHGEVRLQAASVGLQVNCLGGQFTNDTEDQGGGRVAGNALNLNEAQIGLGLLLGPNLGDEALPAVVKGSINLSGAKAGSLEDNKFLVDGDWRQFPRTVHDGVSGDLKCVLVLDGFTYQHLDPAAELGWRRRLDWIERQPPEATDGKFLDQPFNQLASVLVAMGRTEDARRLRIAKEDRLTLQMTVASPSLNLGALRGLGDMYLKCVILGVAVVVFLLLWCGAPWPAAALGLTVLISVPGAVAWLWRALFGATVRYGYAPQWGLAIALATALLGGLYYEGAWSHCALQHKVETHAAKGSDAKPHPISCAASQTDAAFYPYIYSLDVMLPVVKLGQADAWVPTDQKLFDRRGGGGSGWLFNPTVVQKIIWLETVFGWLAGGILATMASGLIKRGGDSGSG